MSANTPASKPQFVYVTYIRTTPEKLWEALTSGEFSKKYWMGFEIKSTWKVGDPISVLSSQHLKFDGVEIDECDGVRGTVLAYEPLKRLSYTFVSGGEKADVAERRKAQGPTKVTYELKPMGPMVRLRLVHENLLPSDLAADPDRWQGVNNGWSAIMSSLKSLLETGKEIQYA